MGGNPAASGLHAIGQGLRRLNDTEISLSSLPDVIAGWWRQIANSAAALLDASIPRFLLADDVHLRIAVANPHHAQLALKRNDTIVSEAPVELGQSSAPSLPLPPARGSTAIISVSDGAALFKRVPINASVRGRKLFRALDYMLEVESPFRRDQILWAYRCPAEPRQGQRMVELVMVPRTIVDPLITQLDSNRVHVLEIQYQASLDPNDIIRIAAYPTPAARRQRYLCLALGILLAVEIAVIAALPLLSNLNQSERLAAKTQELTQIASEFAGVRAKLEKTLAPLGAATAELQALPSPAAVLQILETELGKNVVLDRLSLRGHTVQLAGSTTDFSTIVDRLERSPLLKPKSVTSNGKTGPDQLERFNLTVELTIPQ